MAVDWPVSKFLTEILALGTTAPEASVTVPDSVASATCAPKGSAISRGSIRIPTPRTSFAALAFIGASPLELLCPVWWIFYLGMLRRTPEMYVQADNHTRIFSGPRCRF